MTQTRNGIQTADEDSTPLPRRQTALRRGLRRPSFSLALGFLILLTAVATLAPVITPYDPNAQVLADRLNGPSAQHLFGTDDLGRDVLSRIIMASRLALQAPLICVAVAILVGATTGLLAGLRGGWVDAVTGRIADALLSMPGLAFAMALVAVLGPGLINAMVAMGIIFSPYLYRVVRGATISVSQEAYIESARAIGCSSPRLIASHVVPNIAAPLLVQVTILMGLSLLAEASLSFIGLGVQPPEASWGSMLRSAYENQFEAPYAVVAPGVAIVVTVLCFNTIGDTVRDVIAGGRR